MKNLKKSDTWDLEVVGLIAGFILIVCFDIIFVDAETSPIFLTIVIGMGVILNSVIAMLRFCRDKIASGIFFWGLTVLLLALFVLRLFLIKR